MQTRLTRYSLVPSATIDLFRERYGAAPAPSKPSLLTFKAGSIPCDKGRLRLILRLTPARWWERVQEAACIVGADSVAAFAASLMG